jgi:predicted DNA-binding protein (MmcQ/YjbR family)
VDALERLTAIATALPEAERVDVEEWGDHPTFRVRGKNFVFASADGLGISVKLPKPEAEALVATDPKAEPTGYGLGRHGWVSFDIGARASKARWTQVQELVVMSYCMVAPKRLAAQVARDHAG